MREAFRAMVPATLVAFAVGCGGAPEEAGEVGRSQSALIRVTTFDDVPSRTVIDSHYPGATFSEPLHGGHVYAVASLSGNGNVVSVHDADATWGIYAPTFAAEEGAVDVTFSTPQTSVSIDALFVDALEDVDGSNTKRPYLQAFNASGALLATQYYDWSKRTAWQTLTVTRATADIKRVRFSSQNNFAGLNCTLGQANCPNRIYGGHYGQFDNLRYDDGAAAPAGYQGCYVDDPARALPVSFALPSVTVQTCVAAARAKGYAYAGLQWYGQCYAGNAPGYARVPDTECNTACTANANDTCGGGWRSSIHATGVAPVPPPAGKYQGCYVDDTARALPIALQSSGATVESCVAAAQARGLQYAGLQSYGQCFAGNALGRSRASESDCNTPCDANPNEKCGGAWRNSVYATGVTPPPAVPATAYRGCYTDDESRALKVMLFPSGATVESCVAAAKAKGYAYAGLQYRGTCFGGDAPGFAKVADSECNTRCDANAGETCGGAWRNSIWAAQ